MRTQSSELASKNGYVISLSRPPGFTTTFHVVERVNRESKPHTVWTLCGVAFTWYDLYDVIEDVPLEIKGNSTRLCQRCS